MSAEATEIKRLHAVVRERDTLIAELRAALTAVVEYEASPDFSKWAKVVSDARAAITKSAA